MLPSSDWFCLRIDQIQVIQTLNSWSNFCLCLFYFVGLFSLFGAQVTYFRDLRDLNYLENCNYSFPSSQCRFFFKKHRFTIPFMKRAFLHENTGKRNRHCPWVFSQKNRATANQTSSPKSQPSSWDSHLETESAIPLLPTHKAHLWFGIPHSERKSSKWIWQRPEPPDPQTQAYMEVAWFLCTAFLQGPITLKRCLGDDAQDTRGTLPPGKTAVFEPLAATHYTSLTKGREKARKQPRCWLIGSILNRHQAGLIY